MKGRTASAAAEAGRDEARRIARDAIEWPQAPAGLRSHWLLDPKITFVNHGSFGACPREVLAVQRGWQDRIEAEPVRFFARELEGHLDEARRALAALVGADAKNLAFVPNATHGVNAVMRSLRFQPNDEILTTDHAYAACKNALDFVARRTGTKVVVARIPFPLRDASEVVERVAAAASQHTRLALIDHVTSPTGLVFPVADLVRALDERGIDCLVDGAHAPGMVPLDLRELGAAYYTGNAHKWLCTPKGAAFLHVRPDKQARVRPLVISHGATSPRRDRPRLQLEFDWLGTDDPTAVLSIPAAIRFLSGLFKGGLPALMEHNRRLALAARAHLANELGVALPCPDEMIGTLAALPLPRGDGVAPRSPFFSDALQERLFEQHHIEVPIVAWPAAPQRLVRIAAQAYNTRDDYVRLGEALVAEL